MMRADDYVAVDDAGISFAPKSKLFVSLSLSRVETVSTQVWYKT